MREILPNIFFFETNRFICLLLLVTLWIFSRSVYTLRLKIKTNEIDLEKN